MSKSVDWTVLGRYFGYPECCIKAFNEEGSLITSYLQEGQFDKFKALNKDRENRNKLCGTGYVPCKECSTKSKEELISTIQSSRKSNRPFPEDDHREDIKRAEQMIEELK